MGAARRRPGDRSGTGRLGRLSTARVLAAALARARVRPRARRRGHLRRRSPGSSPAGGRRARAACRTSRTPPGSSPTRRPGGSASGASARPATTSSRRRCPALVSCTQALGEPRYPSLKGIMAARSKEIATRSLADLGVDPATVGGAVATQPGRPVRGAAGRAARRGSSASRRRRPRPRSSSSSPRGGSSDGRGSWSSARSGRTAAWPGSATEVATLARGRSRRPAAREVAGSSSRPTPAPPRPSSPRYLPEVDAVAGARARGRRRPAACGGRRPRASRRMPDYVLVGAAPDGRDVAGILSARLGWGVLANATGVDWGDDGPGRRDERLRRPPRHVVGVHGPDAGS